MTLSFIKFTGAASNVVIEDFIAEDIDVAFRFMPSIQVNDSVTNVTISNGYVSVNENVLYANSPSVTTGPINYLVFENIEAKVNNASSTPFLFNWGPDPTDPSIPLDSFGQKIKNGALVFNNIKVTCGSTASPIFDFNPNTVDNNNEVSNVFIRDIIACGGQKFLNYIGKGTNITVDNIYYNPKRAVFGTASDGQYAFNLNAKDGNLSMVNIDKATIAEGRLNFMKLYAETGNITRLKVVNFDFKSEATTAIPSGHITVESLGGFQINLVKFIAGNIQSEASSGEIFGVTGGTSNKKVLINDLCVSKKAATDIAAASSSIYTVGTEVVTI